jgi:hypothetical protein
MDGDENDDTLDHRRLRRPDVGSSLADAQGLTWHYEPGDVPLAVNALLRPLLSSLSIRCRRNQHQQHQQRRRLCPWKQPAHWMVPSGGERNGADVPQRWFIQGATMIRWSTKKAAA